MTIKRKVENALLSRDISLTLAIIKANDGMTMAAFADELGVSYSTLANWKSGRNTPDVLTLLKVLTTSENVAAQEFSIMCLKFLSPVFENTELLIERLREGSEGYRKAEETIARTLNLGAVRGDAGIVGRLSEDSVQ